MKKNLAIAIILAAALLAGCSMPEKSNPESPSQTAVPVTGGKNNVTIKGFAFTPDSLTIKVGQSVTWTNEDTAGHTVTADDNSWGSQKLNQGDTFIQTFTAAGTYPYHCSIHTEMKGTIIVQP